MSKKTTNGFPREEAKAFCAKAIDDIYDHNPKSFTLRLYASVMEVPEYHIEYDGYAKLCVYSRDEDGIESNFDEGEWIKRTP